MFKEWRWTLLLLALMALALSAGSASATTITLGPSLELPTTGAFELNEQIPQSIIGVNTTPGSGAMLKAPADGTISSWAIRGNTQKGFITLGVLTPQPGGLLKRHAESNEAIHLNGSPNTTSLPINVGDMLSVFLVKELPTVSGDHVAVAIGVDPAAVFQSIGIYSEEGSEPFEPIAGRSLLYDATVELASPGMSAMSPKSGTGGTVVAITGQHLAVATAVTFGGIPATSFSGDDSQITAIAPPRPAGGTVEVQVTTAGGTTIVAPLSLFTYPTPPSAPDTTAPEISALRFAPSTFQAANIGGSIIARRVGSQVSYQLSEPATTTFTVQRVMPGRRSGKRCVAPSRRKSRARKCTRLKNVKGSFQRSAAAGTDSFDFSARLSNRALSPGSYRLNAVARDAAGNSSKVATRAFNVVR